MRYSVLTSLYMPRSGEFIWKIEIFCMNTMSFSYADTNSLEGKKEKQLTAFLYHVIQTKDTAEHTTLRWQSPLYPS